MQYVLYTLIAVILLFGAAQKFFNRMDRKSHKLIGLEPDDKPMKGFKVYTRPEDKENGRAA